MTPTTLRRRFLAALARHEMIAAGERVLAAVSGGPDSTAMLDLLAWAAPEREFLLAVAHLDHGLRGAEGEADRRFVEEMAGRLDLPFFSASSDVAALARAEGRSIEEAGRLARGRFLTATARRWEAGRIAVGQHRDDLAEGLLMRLIQGSGPSGLAAIRPVTGAVIRPLIEASREEILEHLAARSLPFRQDVSNRDTAFLRNRVRARLLPLLEAEFNPRVREALARCSRIARDEDDLLARQAGDWLARHVQPSGIPHWLPLAALASAPPALARRVVRGVLASAGVAPRAARFDQIETLLDLVRARRTGAAVAFAGGWRARIGRDRVELARRAGPFAPEGAPAFPVLLAVPGRTLLPSIGALVCSLAPPEEPAGDPRSGRGTRADVDFDRTGAELLVRRPSPGERFHPLGAPGSKPLAEFLAEAGVPCEERPSAPIVAARRPAGTDPGPGGAIVWVVGRRIAERFRLTADTRRVLRLRIAPPA